MIHSPPGKKLTEHEFDETAAMNHMNETITARAFVMRVRRLPHLDSQFQQLETSEYFEEKKRRDEIKKRKKTTWDHLPESQIVEKKSSKKSEKPQE